METIRAICLVVIAVFFCAPRADGAELRGHGGPVRAIAVSADGKTAITGSFDSRAIIWSLETGEAKGVLQFHDDQVNAVAALPDNRFASAGADGRIALWRAGQSAPLSILEGHTGPVAALALSPDGLKLASASWDGSVRLWPLNGGKPRALQGHQGNVNAVAFLPDGTLVSGGNDATVIMWADDGRVLGRISMPAPITTIATTSTGRLLIGGIDGVLRTLERSGAIVKEVKAFSGPLTALAISEDDSHVAVSAIRGAVSLFSTDDLEFVRSFDIAGVAIWSLAFSSKDRTLLAGCGDHIVREFNVGTGRRLNTTSSDEADPMMAFAGNPDAEVYRACIACHTLDPDDGNRAGPTLSGIFGRRIASVPGYSYSPAFREMDIIWTPETVSKLFELGPAIYTPGTKMPQQTINDSEERAALIRFLKAEAGDE